MLMLRRLKASNAKGESVASKRGSEGGECLNARVGATKVCCLMKIKRCTVESSSCGWSDVVDVTVADVESRDRLPSIAGIPASWLLPRQMA